MKKYLYQSQILTTPPNNKVFSQIIICNLTNGLRVFRCVGRCFHANELQINHQGEINIRQTYDSTDTACFNKNNLIPSATCGRPYCNVSLTNAMLY